MKKYRMSALKKRNLVAFFVTKVTARNAAKILGIHPKTAAYFYLRLRKIIFEYTIQERTHVLGGKIELDERYCGGKKKGKRGRGAAEKIPFLGLLQRGGKVYAEVIKDTKSISLISIAKAKVSPHNFVYTDTYGSYSSLIPEGFKHHRNHHKKELALNNKHVNRIENVMAYQSKIFTYT